MYNKYHNKKTVIDGITFHSLKEGARYSQLKLMIGKDNGIKDLKLQVKFPFIYEGKKIFTYIADFTYYDNLLEKEIVEDVKSLATAKLPVYRLKKKLIESQYKIEIKET